MCARPRTAWTRSSNEHTSACKMASDVLRPFRDSTGTLKGFSSARMGEYCTDGAAACGQEFRTAALAAFLKPVLLKIGHFSAGLQLARAHRCARKLLKNALGVYRKRARRNSIFSPNNAGVLFNGTVLKMPGANRISSARKAWLECAVCLLGKAPASAAAPCIHATSISCSGSTKVARVSRA